MDVIFWPSLVGHPPGTVDDPAQDTADLGCVHRTAVLARRLGAFVVQSNRPNARNTPNSTFFGASKVDSASGEILLTLPRDQPGIGVFAFCEREFFWTPAPF